MSVQGVRVFRGAPLEYDAKLVSSAMNSHEVVFEVNLGVGDARGTAWGCDLTEGYVKINAEYTT